MERYPLSFKLHIMIFGNVILGELILSIFHDIVPQIFIVIFDSVNIALLKLV